MAGYFIEESFLYERAMKKYLLVLSDDDITESKKLRMIRESHDLFEELLSINSKPLYIMRLAESKIVYAAFSDGEKNRQRELCQEARDLFSPFREIDKAFYYRYEFLAQQPETNWFD